MSAGKLMDEIVKRNQGFRRWPGSVVSNAVYSLTYEELGAALSGMHPMWDDMPMIHDIRKLGNESGEVCGHNGFEEFVVLAVESMFETLCVYAAGEDGEEIDDMAVTQLRDWFDGGSDGKYPCFIDWPYRMCERSAGGYGERK